MSNKAKIKSTNMYDSAETWNPIKGCLFDCTYCGPSFKAQAKRQKHNCTECYEFRPHQHPERLSKIPNAEIVFVGGNGDISFCDPAFVKQIIAAIVKKNLKRPNQVYYFQTKRPEYLAQFIGEFPKNVILVTTLESNRDEGYGDISKAPKPSERYEAFEKLDWPNKVVTIEPIMNFDLDVFSEWLITLAPDCVWLGFNSRPRSVNLPEPSNEKVLALVKRLKEAGIRVRGKELRGLELSPKPLVGPKTEEALREAWTLAWALLSYLDDAVQDWEGIPTENVVWGDTTVGKLLTEVQQMAESAKDNLISICNALNIEENQQ